MCFSHIEVCFHYLCFSFVLHHILLSNGAGGTETTTVSVTESQKGWGWKGPPKTTWPNTLLSLDPVVQDHVQMAVEYLQRGRLHNLPGQLAWCSVTLTVKKCFPELSKFSSFSWRQMEWDKWLDDRDKFCVEIRCQLSQLVRLTPGKYNLETENWVRTEEEFSCFHDFFPQYAPVCHARNSFDLKNVTHF